MAIERVYEKILARTASKDENGRTGFQLWFVETDGTVKDPFVVMAAKGLPRLGNSWVTTELTDFFLRVTNFGDPTQTAPTLWEVPINFMSTVADAGPDQENPLAQRRRITFDFTGQEEQIENDINNVPLSNTALEPFDPRITKPTTDIRIVISRNEADFNGSFFESFKDAINTDTFLGLAPGRVKLTGIRATERTTQDETFTFFEVTYTFDVREPGPADFYLRPKFTSGTGVEFDLVDFPAGAPPWKRRLLNQGYREITGVDGDGFPIIKNITDENGDPVSEPVWLAQDGTKLLFAAKPLFILADTFREKPFAQLGLE